MILRSFLFFLIFPENGVRYLMQTVSSFLFFPEMFFKKMGFDISSKLSPEEETVCMKCQIRFSGKNKKKKTLICCLPDSNNRTIQYDDLFVADLYSGKIFVAMSGKFWHCLFLCFKNSCCWSFS